MRKARRPRLRCTLFLRTCCLMMLFSRADSQGMDWTEIPEETLEDCAQVGGRGRGEAAKASGAFSHCKADL